MSDLEERIGYRFRDARVREAALTHSSHRNESDETSDLDSERLEFLGDSVLGYLVSRRLFARFPEMREGDLTKLRAHLVSARHLAAKARVLDLGRALRLGRGEELSGGREKDSILADAYEALVAGIFLDGGIEAAEAFAERDFGREIEALAEGPAVRDHKSRLQETLYRRGLPPPVYQVVDEAGPAHRRLFEVSVRIDGREAGRGSGTSKKSAQQDAARAALEGLGGEDAPADGP